MYLFVCVLFSFPKSVLNNTFKLHPRAIYSSQQIHALQCKPAYFKCKKWPQGINQASSFLDIVLHKVKVVSLCKDIREGFLQITVQYSHVCARFCVQYKINLTDFSNLIKMHLQIWKLRKFILTMQGKAIKCLKLKISKGQMFSDSNLLLLQAPFLVIYNYGSHMEREGGCHS